MTAKLVSAAFVAGIVAAGSLPAQAADTDYNGALGLIVSGIVENWTGHTFLADKSGNAEAEPEDYFASGHSGRLSLPLGDTLSIQMDGDIEYTNNAFNDSTSSNTFKWSSQIGSHLTWRDAGIGAIGAFGAFGRSQADEDRHDFYAVGGEAQFFVDNLTLYAQAGYLDSRQIVDDPEDRLKPFRDAAFVRGVARWFIAADSRVEGEVSFATGSQGDPPANDMELLEWSVRYDTVLTGIPVIGDTQVHVAYRGAHYDNKGDAAGDDDGQFSEHTIMVGTSYSFGGDTLREFDRNGASLDLPGFGRWVGAGSELN